MNADLKHLTRMRQLIEKGWTQNAWARGKTGRKIRAGADRPSHRTGGERVMRTDLLKTLADHLDTVPVENFNMKLWQARNECGFAGCAIGHAEGLPGFEGLTFEPDIAEHGLFVPVYDGFSGWQALVWLFGHISVDDAIYLFSPKFYSKDVAPAMVAARIREFIKRKDEE